MSSVLFVIKKVLGKLLMPLPFGCIVLVIALFFYWRGYRRTSKLTLAAVLGSWFLLSLYPVANSVIAPLEHRYPKYSGEAVSRVVVLGGYHQSDSRIPVSSLLSQTSLMRLTEGVHIYRQNIGAKLMLSGYKGHDQISNAEAMARVARTLGVPDSDIILESDPKDTAEEAKAWAGHLKDHDLKGQGFALVTSASHMPRAVSLFQQQGLKPVPAPTAYYSIGQTAYRWNSFFPNAGAIKIVEMAWHEYLGIMWAELNKKAAAQTPQ